VSAQADAGVPEAAPRWWVSATWWAATIASLVIVDDLVAGPVFWTTSILAGAGVAAIAVACIYIPLQLTLVAICTADPPHPLAARLLRRLRIGQRRGEIGERDAHLHSMVGGIAAAIAVTPLIGGVLPIILLSRQGYPRTTLRWLAVITAVIYAAEFAFLHSYLPSLTPLAG
jgi:hypothetical protein